MKYLLSVLSLAILFSPLIDSASAQTYSIENAFPGVSFQQPLDIQIAGDGSNRLFIVERNGTIRFIDNNPSVSNSTLFLDINGRVFSGGGEEGLLGLAFDPDYSSNGYFYVYYIANNPRRSVVSRFSVSAGDPNSADDTSELILLEFNQPDSNHNGGQLRFGPDGMLYISSGDGGGSGDPDDNGEDRTNLLGAILRIDVSSSAPGSLYAIPADNPFVGNSEGYREEIYAWGLRNPWRFSFDSATGSMWVADVGQRELEEINIVENGKNYGWNTMEGTACFDPSSGCDQAGLELPIWEYNHDNDDQSITGGFVYHGTQLPGLTGKYIYGDFVSTRIWALEFDLTSAIDNTLLVDQAFGVSAFGLDADGELLISGYNGTIYKLVQTSVSVEEMPGSDLSISVYPNPFRSTSTISLSTDTPVEVSIDVFDILGRRIVNLASNLQVGANTTLQWDGLDGSGKEVAPGTYIYRIETPSGTLTRSFSRL